MKILASIALAFVPAVAFGQHEHGQHEHGQHEPLPDEHAAHDEPHPATVEQPAGLSLPHGRDGSGTSWMPDSTPVFAHHFMVGDWMLMLHYSAIVGYDDQWSDRGSRRALSTNWVMGMASHPLLGGELTFRTMLSAEPATAGGRLAIPLLLQSGETYGGEPLHDRQHPHDLFMELAVRYRRSFGDAFGIELYAAPSGEPALGPTAFMHRLSAMNNPYPPISHHWQDSTHITFPVLTAGVYNRWLKLEGSLFHGREPDEDRWNLDIGALDSWSVRLSANPTTQTSFQVSYGFLKSPEALVPTEDLHRLTASAMWSSPLSSSGNLALTAVWGRNQTHHGHSDSLLGEVQVDLDGRNVPFARIEWVEKLGHDLVLPGDPEAKYGVVQTALGYAYRFTQLGPLVPLVGAAVNVGVVPEELRPAYGTRVPFGAFVFLGVQPRRAEPMHHSMAGM